MCVSRPNQQRQKKLLPAPNSEHPPADDDYWGKLVNTTYSSVVLENCVHVWVLPLNISQSKYGGRRTPSSACTLITVQIAHDFLDSWVPLPDCTITTSQHLPNVVLETLVNAIVDGNETHENAMAERQRGITKGLGKKEEGNQSMLLKLLKKPQRDTFTVPEAIQAHKPEMHEIDYRSYNGHFIGNLVSALEMVVTSPLLRHLNRIPIGVLAFERAMSLLYDRRSHSICLMDTHMHFKAKAGSIIISSSYDNLTDFVVTVVKCAFHEVFRKTDLTGQFEITCLMLTRLFDKSLRGRIFTTITNCPQIFPTKGLKIVKKKIPTQSSDSDEGYQTCEEDIRERKSEKSK